MCGIAGYVGRIAGDSSRVDASIRMAIRYRGRDGEGAWGRGNPDGIKLFHSRLSIIDLTDGDQPMLDHTGRYVIVFNGEIYNYIELRRLYELQGARFRTHSDTEIILEGYKLRGPAVCGDLNGMFAFAIWDTLERRLFMARDRLGKKPLYWTSLSGVFYFASTLDAFSDVPGWTGRPSLLALDCYTALGSFLPGTTAFAQGHSLAPASWAVLEPGRSEPATTVYWRMDFSTKRRIGLEAALEEFEALATDAIAIRLRADVSVALTFSGGVDSGIIAAIVKKRLGRDLDCWTIDYDTEDDPSEETRIARQVADHLGLSWRYEHFDYRNELVATIKAALAVVDQPCNQVPISYSRRLYGRIGQQAKVVLSGNGADELFLGYNGNEELRRKDDALPSSLLTRILALAPGGPRRRREVLARYQCDYVAANLAAHDNEADPLTYVEAIRQAILDSNIASYADLYTYMALTFYTCDPNFRVPDMAGLDAQVEVRSPFLDYRMVEFAARLPTDLKVGTSSDASGNKLLLKTYYERYVPHEVAWAAKKGMGWNLRWGQALVSEPQFAGLYEEMLARIAASGLPVARYRQAWESFAADKRAGVAIPRNAGPMVAGLMLGFWLSRGNVAGEPARS